MKKFITTLKPRKVSFMTQTAFTVDAGTGRFFNSRFGNRFPKRP